MDFLFINQQELSALKGLPHLQQLTYLTGIRPYMDRKTSMVGIKRGISYQSLSEALYVEPHQGIQSGSPSKEQLRRIIKSLEKVGLIELHSTEKRLILKCLLASSHFSVQNKPDIKPTPHPNSIEVNKNVVISMHSEISTLKPDTEEMPKADIPHNSVNSIACVYARFEKFWGIYPEPQNREKALVEFEKLNPDERLFNQMLEALKAQVTHYEQQQAEGNWVPHWKYPANWISQKSWNDPIPTAKKLEPTHAKRERNTSTKSAFDIFWESCKDGADFNLYQDEQPAENH